MNRNVLLLLLLLALATPALGQGVVPAASYAIEAQRVSEGPLEVGAEDVLKVRITRSCPAASIEQPETAVVFRVHADDPALRVLGPMEAVMPSQVCLQGGETSIEHRFDLALAHAPNATFGSVLVQAQPEQGGHLGPRPEEVSATVAVPMASPGVVDAPAMHEGSQESPGAGPLVLVASFVALGVAMRRR